MLKEFDCVKSMSTIKYTVPKGTLGVIVMIVDENRRIYEVEFFDANFNTIDIIEVSIDQIEKVDLSHLKRN